MKRFMSLFLCVLLAASLCLTGCEKKGDEGPFLYYLSLDGTSLSPEKIKLPNGGLAEQLDFFLDEMQKAPNGNIRQVIPNSVEVLDTSFNGYMLTINFSSDYYKMSVTEEILVRAAIVRTLTQIEGITFVEFFVENTPLVDANDIYVGSMSADSFVENPGAQINNSISTTITLYFSSPEGDSLMKETRTVHHSSNISFEKLIMTQLIEGTNRSKMRSTIPKDTKLINISTVDGVCYVNFDENFQNQDETISEEVVLYSIVNSLSELSTVDSVQISINGDTSKKVRYLYNLSKPYTYSSDVIYVPGNDVEGTEHTETTETETNTNLNDNSVNTHAGVTDAMTQFEN